MNLSYIEGNRLLFDFYFKNINKIKSLPKWMRNPDHLIKEMELRYNQNDNNKNSGFSLRLPTSTAKEYNGEFENMKSEMRKLHGTENEKFSYKTTLILLFSIRILCILTAYQGNVTGTIALSLLQFLVAPYSFFVSFGLAIALGPPIYFSHYLTFNSIEIISNLLQTFCLPTSITSILAQISPYLELPIGPAFILAFFIFDQGLCFYVHYFTPSKIFTLRETMTHFIWGFLNTKTYTLVIFLHMMNAGVKIPIWIWIIDANFQLTNKLSKIISDRWMHWLELFYHQHRMAHLPKVYEHAHKLHHYLHGTLSFDAHIYGNGMPEEFFFLLLELLAGTWYGKMPATLNKNIIQYSIDNKFGHTQKPEDTCGDNFHPDHHLYHMKNFGIYNSLMDMYFGTSTNNEKYMVKPSLYYTDEQEIIFDIEKKIENDETVFYFTPRSVNLTRKGAH